MAMFSVNTHRFDPYKNFKFRVKWDGEYVPGIVRVSPLLRNTEAVVHREGAEPSSHHVAPGATTFVPVTLERGLSHDPAFEEWAELVFSRAGDADMSLRNYRKDVVIELLNLQGSVVLAYMVRRAWVMQYQALPALDANAACVAIERIVLAHEGWERDRSVSEPTET